MCFAPHKAEALTCLKESFLDFDPQVFVTPESLFDTRQGYSLRFPTNFNR